MAQRDEIIEEIRRAADIVDVIGEFVDLRKQGRNFLGLCPFHEEKTPSFTVSAEKEIYKCFGCGKAGTVFNFLMDYHGVGFVEARDMLAKKYGITISHQPGQKIDRKALTLRDHVLKALGAAASFYAYYLRTSNGKDALNYFHKRDFSNDLINRFSLGYAPDSWDALSKELIKQGFTEKVLFEAGLIIKKDNGGYYDRFRGRAIFPIKDFLGKIVAFGARRMNEDDNQPKYINSPQGIVYDKSASLYGYFEGKNSIRNQKSAIMVEGYADVLSLHQAGIDNAVASSGTSLTKEQLNQLSRLCKEMYIIYDSDEAGVKAADRAIELALEKGFEIKIVQLPEGEDPDSMVRAYGKDTFNTYIREAESFLGFKTRQFKQAGRLDSPQAKADSTRELVKIISNIPDRLQHDFYIRQMAPLMDLSESQIRKVYQEKSAIENKSRYNQRLRNKIDPQKPASDSDKPGKETNDRPGVPGELTSNPTDILESILPEEFLLLHMALSEEEALRIMVRRHKLNSSKFITAEGKRLIDILIKHASSSGKILSGLLEDEDIIESDKQALTSISFREERSEHWIEFGAQIEDIDVDRNIRDALNRLEIASINNSLPELRSSIKKDTPLDEQLEILKKIDRLSRKKSQLQGEFVKFKDEEDLTMF